MPWLVTRSTIVSSSSSKSSNSWSEQRNELHAGAPFDGPADDGAVFDGIGVRAIQVHPPVQGLAVEQIRSSRIRSHRPPGLRAVGSSTRQRKRNDRVARLRRVLPAAAGGDRDVLAAARPCRRSAWRSRRPAADAPRARGPSGFRRPGTSRRRSRPRRRCRPRSPRRRRSSSCRCGGCPCATSCGYSPSGTVHRISPDTRSMALSVPHGGATWLARPAGPMKSAVLVDGVAIGRADAARSGAVPLLVHAAKKARRVRSCSRGRNWRNAGMPLRPWHDDGFDLLVRLREVQERGRERRRCPAARPRGRRHTSCS